MFANTLRVPAWLLETLISSVQCSLLIIVAVFAFADQAMARPEMAGGSTESRFTAIDADKDGKISREEFFAAQPQMKDSAFEAIDLDKDGFISLGEWVDFSKGHGSSMSPKSEGQTEATQAPGTENKTKAAPNLIMPPARQ